MHFSSLDSVKAILHVPADETALDEVLTDLLDVVSAECERFCSREFALVERTETYQVSGVSAFPLRHRPVAELTLVGFSSNAYDLDPVPGIVRLFHGRFCEPVTATYVAGFDVIPDDLAYSVAKLAAAHYQHRNGVIDSSELDAEERRAHRKWVAYA